MNENELSDEMYMVALEGHIDAITEVKKRVLPDMKILLEKAFISTIKLCIDQIEKNINVVQDEMIKALKKMQQEKK